MVAGRTDAIVYQTATGRCSAGVDTYDIMRSAL